MTEVKFISPLQWPTHQRETDRLKRSNNNNFQQPMTEDDAIRYLVEEVNQTPSITSATLSCNATNLNSTQPTSYIGKQPGAAIEIRVDGSLYHLGSDRWMMISHNIYALHLAIRQMRQISAYGIGELSQLLAGFSLSANAHNTSARPSQFGENNVAADWQRILGLGETATLDDANTIYRHRALKIGEHDPDALQTLNLAIAQARESFGK